MDIPQLQEIADGESIIRCGTGFQLVSEEPTGWKPVPRGVHGLEARATELPRLNVKSYQSGIVMVKG